MFVRKRIERGLLRQDQLRSFQLNHIKATKTDVCSTKQNSSIGSYIGRLWTPTRTETWVISNVMGQARENIPSRYLALAMKLIRSVSYVERQIVNMRNSVSIIVTNDIVNNTVNKMQIQS